MVQLSSKLAVLAAILLLGAPARAEGLEFLLHGKPLKSFSDSELRKIAPPESLKVWEFHEKKEVPFEGHPARDLLKKAYGKSWNTAEEILITCTDGFQPSIPAELLREGEALFANRRTDQEQFTVEISGERKKRVPLGPYYLVWENLKNPAIRAQGGNIWPYQIAKVDLVRFRDRFPKLAPPAGAPASVREGFLGYRQHCMSCHPVNGEGGRKARDLVAPEAAVHGRARVELVKFILDPQSVKPGFPMPGLSPEIPNRPRTAERIVDYLHAMTQ
ncbi:MAG: hypothetical protein IT285_07545 [Bdellovibrionales bacterium]|nr:hypothetical protein [Bdellovibrionales bacterium]